MDLGDLGKLIVQNGAPLVGGLLQTAASAAGGPAAGAIAGVLLDAIGKKLGTASNSPDDIAAAITANPTVAQSSLAEIETAHAAVIKATGDIDMAHLADIQDARHQAAQYAAQGSPMAWGPVVISVLVIFFFAAVIILIVTKSVNITDTIGQMMYLILGTLTAGFTQVLNYWLGSSSGSSDKSNQIADLAKAAVGIKTSVAVPKRGK